MADLDLGALSAQLKLGVEDLDARVKQVVSRLDDLDASTTKAQKKTEDLGKTLKSALKGEVLNSSIARAAQGLSQLEGQFSGLTRAVQGTGIVLQGLFQGGGIAGGIIAAIGYGVSTITAEWAASQEATEKAASAVRDQYKKAVDDTLASIAKLDERIAIAKRAQQDKTSLEVAGGRLASEGAAARLSKAQIALDQPSAELADLQDRALAERARLREQFGAAQAGSDSPLLRDLEAQIKDLESKMKPLTEEFRAASLAAEEANKAVAAKDEEGKAAGVSGAGPVVRLQRSIEEQIRTTKDATKAARLAAQLSDRDPSALFAFQEKQARAAWEAQLGRTTEPGSITEERLAREERNRMAREAGAVTQQFSEEQDRKAHERWKSQSDGRTKNDLNTLDDNKSSGMSRVTQDLKEQLKDLEYAVKTAVSGLGSVAPKTATLVAALASEDWGTAIGVIASNSKEFSKLGELLDKGLVDSINAVTSNIRYALPTIKIAIDAIVEVAGLAGNLLGLANVFNGQENKFREMFEAIKYFGFGVSWLSAAVKWVGNAIKDVMADAVVFILESNDITKALFAEQITKLKASKSGQGEFLDATWNASKKWLDLSYDATMAGLNLDDLGGAADKVAQSLLNLPAGFKVNAAIYDAANASGDVWGGYVPPGSTASMPTAAAAAATASTGSVYNFYAPIYVNGDGSFEANVARGAPQLPPPNRPTTYPPNP